MMRSVSVLLALLLLMPAARSRSDPYGESRMDLHSAAAALSAERHSGEFAVGRSLSAVPEVPPLDLAPVKTIQPDVVDRVIDLAPGVRLSAWTFGGQVPGAIAHARVDDTEANGNGFRSPTCRRVSTWTHSG